ncbi:hypothetical protein KI387_018275, partial [Taxus chinensis]
MKECELCQLPARMYCESDNANLCWKCDGKVHAANFLVARHSRILLCQICQTVTAWRASGSNPGPTVSVCEKCVAKNKEQTEENNDENQVVPLASAVSGPPLTSSSSTGDEQRGDSEEEEEQSSPLKRLHDSLDLRTSEGGDHGCSSSGPNNNWSTSSRSGYEDDATTIGIHRLKKRKQEDCSNGGVVQTLERMQREGGSSNSTVSAIFKL